MVALLRQASTSIADCAGFTASFWFRFPSSTTNLTVGNFLEFGSVDSNFSSYIHADVNGGVINEIHTNFSSPADASDSPSFHCYKISESALSLSKALGAWHHLLIAVNFNWTNSVNAVGPFPLWIYLDGASVGLNGGSVSPTNAGFGLPPRVGTGIFVEGGEVALPHWQANPFGWSDTTFEMADFQAWFGTYIDPTVASNFSKFVSVSGGVGTPINPATAATAFGDQTILFKGNSSTFSTNAGNGGAFVKTGTINSFTPTPSYS